MKKIVKIRIIATLAATYIMMSFIWWTILLNRKNIDLIKAETEVLRLKTYPTYGYYDFIKTPQYLGLKAKHQKQANMILGEGVVLFAGLIWGLWLINRSFQKELALNNQQRNFILSITHELKSPISSIQLVLDTFRKRKLDEKQIESLTLSATKETERLNELVNNLLLSAKLETTYEPYFEPLNLQSILEDIIVKLKLRFPKAIFQFDNKSAPSLMGDKQGIISIFNNLLENAIKYSNAQPIIHIQNRIENNRVVFEIMDNGLGIPAQEKQKIFDKFYRIGNEDTRNTKGTGLGLYIVSQILKAHKGSIQVLDNKPTGTIFRVTLPS